MVSGLFAVATAIWYFITANKIGKNAWIWAAIGFISFQGIFTIFTKFIVLPVSLFTSSVHGNTLFNSLIWVIVTALTAVAVTYIRTNYLKGKVVARSSSDS